MHDWVSGVPVLSLHVVLNQVIHGGRLTLVAFLFTKLSLTRYSDFAILGLVQGERYNSLMENLYSTFTLRETEKFLKSLPPKDEAKIRASLHVMKSGDFKSPYIKTLRGPIKELIVSSYRFIFFISPDHTIYFTSAFRKKSRKTPQQEIDKAEHIYTLAIAEYNEKQRIQEH